MTVFSTIMMGTFNFYPFVCLSVCLSVYLSVYLPIKTGVLISRSWSLKDGLVLAGIAVSCQLLSILYFRFAYHRVYEGIVCLFFAVHSYCNVIILFLYLPLAVAEAI